MNPKVSIIIPFYNCPFITQSIESALNQSYKNIEVIVVDDGSTIHAEKITPYKKDIKYIRKENGGTATALNSGCHHATGEYVAWLSSDDYFLKDKISKQLEFTQHNEADASFTDYIFIDENDNRLPFKSPVFSPHELHKIILEMNPINGSTVILKRNLFAKVGYFNADLKYTQDYDMWFRIIMQEYKMCYLNEVLTNYRIHPQSGTKKNQHALLEEIEIVRNYYRPLFKSKFQF